MGLDMYLYPVDKIPKTFDEAWDMCGRDYSEVGYWRKSNFLHNWFMKYGTTFGNDDQIAYISRNKLKELLTTCMAVYVDHSQAPKLLPTRDGFMFGSLKYDDNYFYDLSRTIHLLMDILENEEIETNHFIYYASW